MHVELDGGGHGHGDVVVRGLAGEDGVQVLAPQLGDDELVGDLGAHRVVRVVEECVVAPPGDLENRGHS